jgi:hypothetical protein
MSTPSRLGCDDMEDLAPELALGTLTGTERADAVDHLASCPDCQRRVTELAQIVDTLLLLAPEEDPSPDLEARVLARTVADQPADAEPERRAPWRRRVLVGSIAAAVVAALALTIVNLVRDGGADADTVRTAVATEDGGRSVCRAVINEVDPAWLFVSLDDPGEDGAGYDVEIRFDTGETARVGRIDLHDGHGELAVTLDLQGSRAHSVRLIGADGEFGYEARFL